MSTPPKQEKDAVRVIRVGPVTLTVQAALVLALGTALTACLTLLGVLVHPAFIIAGGLPMLAFTVYVTYLVNCLVVGHCVILSWFFVAMLGAYTLVALSALLHLSALLNGKKK